MDLAAGELLEEMFRLPLEIAVPDILYMEELVERHAALPGLGLQILVLSGEGVGAAEALGKKYPLPGRNDMVALALALEKECGLLTGDRHLRSAAEAEEVEVHGTLWIMERFHVELGMAVEMLEEAYARMRQQGRRLPWADVAAQLEDMRR